MSENEQCQTIIIIIIKYVTLPRLLLLPFTASSSSPRAASDLEQARPQTSGEEELQLQLALAMSREESKKVVYYKKNTHYTLSSCTATVLPPSNIKSGTKNK